MLSSDKLLTVLLDKDGRVHTPPIPTDRDYHVKRPTPEFFDDSCNEFWWVSTYVAKGLCRNEILYAAEHLNLYVRPNLLRMLAWKVGLENGFSLSVGKSYKYLDKYLSIDLWDRLLATYRNSSCEEMWQALFACQELFRETAGYVAQMLGYTYPDYDGKVTTYLKKLFEDRTQ